jgi:hypothetical protein
MPDIPDVPGVPALSSYAASAGVLLVGDLLSDLTGIAPPQWGVFLDGEPVILADNQVSFEIRQDFPISDYPVEQGGFQSYDKVQLPIEIRVSFSAGGSESDRQAFLQSIQAVINTTDLYDVVTPEQTFMSFCFKHWDLRRTADKGVGLIVADLWLEEIRVTSTATTSLQNTQQPGEAGQVGTGSVPASTPAAALINQYFSTGGAS